MSSSSSTSRARRGGSGSLRQFPVGRSSQWRHVAVVDAGCGCRPRRATSRLLSQLPSFLRPSPKPPQQQPQPLRSSSRSSSGFFPSSASTASSAASAATFTTTHSSAYSNYSAYSSYGYNNPTAAAVTKHPPASKAPAAAPASTRTRRQQHGGHGHQSRRKKRYEKMGTASAQPGAAEDDVGVAVEKESSDPRADFRESMVQMVVEMGLCGWDDLRCMLRRLLALNAPRHHAAILAAFAEVCAQLTAPPPPPPPPPQPAYQYHAYDDYHYHY